MHHIIPNTDKMRSLNRLIIHNQNFLKWNRFSCHMTLKYIADRSDDTFWSLNGLMTCSGPDSVVSMSSPRFAYLLNPPAFSNTRRRILPCGGGDDIVTRERTTSGAQSHGAATLCSSVISADQRQQREHACGKRS